LLLRPATHRGGFALNGATRDQDVPRGTIVGAVYSFDRPVSEAFIEGFASTTLPALTAAGVSIVATLVTENAANNFPALPVREGENVFVFFGRLRDEAGYASYRRTLDASRDAAAISQRLRLAPTTRSLLR